MSKIIKAFIKRHRRILSAIHYFRNTFFPVPIYSWEDVGIMVDDWTAKYLPNDFDCIIGIPRGGLVIADRVALNFGKPLSTPDDFIHGIRWQSKCLPISPMKRVLVIDDSVGEARMLQAETARLRRLFPHVQFETASLVNAGNPDDNKVAYSYVTNKIFAIKTDVLKYRSYRRRVLKSVRVHFDSVDGILDGVLPE